MSPGFARKFEQLQALLITPGTSDTDANSPYSRVRASVCHHRLPRRDLLGLPFVDLGLNPSNSRLADLYRPREFAIAAQISQMASAVPDAFFAL